MGRYAIGVDGGQSSTLAVVAEASGKVLGSGTAGPSNHITEPGGPERCQKAVTDSVRAAVESAGVTLDEVGFVLCGMTGAFPATRDAVDRALLDIPHRMVHDSVTAFHGATGGKPGSIVIGGTGSVGYGENEYGESLRLGGWGYLMGDEGSSYWVALEAVRAIALAEDLRAPTTALSELLPQAVGAGDIRSFHTWLYGENDRSKIARLSGTVDRAAEAGDRVAKDILSRAGVELAKLSSAILSRLSMESGQPYVSYVGGLFRSQTVRASFAATVSEDIPGATVAAPQLPPVGGAALLAIRGLTGEVGEGVLSALEASLKEMRIEG